MGDLNGDGLPDIGYAASFVIGDSVPVHFLLTDGKGSYRSGTDITLPSGTTPACLAVDVNGDSKSDLVCSGDETHAQIAVLLGNGDGTFASPVVQSVPPLSHQVGDGNIVSAAGDLNNDGHPDLVITNEIAGVLVPMLGDGTGHFTAAAPLFSAATHVTLLDLNGDGNLDMVAQGVLTKATSVYLGHGDGSFGSIAQTWTTNYDSVLGDVDGDGHPDLIGGGYGTLQVFRGQSSGGFDASPTQLVNFNGSNPSDGFGHAVYILPLACLDLDGDGHPDLVAAGGNGLVVFSGKGGLQFDSPRSYPAEQMISYGNFGGQRLLDMDGDGHPDYVALGPDGLYISYGQADGTFQVGREYTAGATVADFTLADFDEDGLLDVVTAGDLQMYLSHGKADGSFANAVALPFTTPAVTNPKTQGWVSVAHGDVNGDGHQDLLAVHAVQSSLPELTVLLGHGDGTFDDPVPVQSLNGSPFLKVLDVNGDGRADVLLTQGSRLTLLLSQKDGSFRSVAGTLTAPASEYANTPPTLGDLNGDGLPDIAYATTNHLAVAAGQGDGSFGPPIFYNLPLPANTTSLGEGTIALGDFDGDGATDIAVLLPTDGPGQNDIGVAHTFVLYGQGKKGAFNSDSFTAAVAGPVAEQGLQTIAAADLDGDGRTDIILSSPVAFGYPASDQVLRGNADRTLGNPVDLVAGYGQRPPLFGDLNGDGRADLVKPMTFGNSFSVLLTLQPIQPVGTLTVTPSPVPAGGAFTIAAALAADGQSGPFQGTVTYAIDGNKIGSASLVNGTASIGGPTTLAVGKHAITATTSILKDAQGSYAPVTMTGTETVTLLPVLVSITSSVTPLIVTQSTTLAVQVANGIGSPAGAPLPSGQVTVQVDGVTLGTGSGDGKAALNFSLPYTGSVVGTHTVTVSYPGDATHQVGSAVLQLVVSAVPGSFTLSAAPATVNVSRSAPGSTQLTVSSVSGFFGPVALSYSGLPAQISATLNPTTVTLSAGGRANATLTFTESGTAAAQPASRSRTMVAFAALMMLALPSAGRRRWKGMTLLLALATFGAGLEGCSHPSPPAPAPKSYTVTVTGTGTGTQGAAATTAITVSVTQ